ncbi:hypothetical protein PSEUBRA_005734 [Kalmanozyma brasiliensis GHG001]|uniref:uncharacterized protein n=1 Tax=Kalmanozyma brasiliensis (strain GHG001) TaxID=1365824 RepID=UPI002867BD3F|nr:uncharacterized protein PSEUBRA_005734 [Kalmanozyma brasiliensis GHG001]KAF6767553.1 hypothetical protein PSEUBRA_005734 [Kalmanozyma brasiliensis GHG001]
MLTRNQLLVQSAQAAERVQAAFANNVEWDHLLISFKILLKVIDDDSDWMVGDFRRRLSAFVFNVAAHREAFYSIFDNLDPDVPVTAYEYEGEFLTKFKSEAQRGQSDVPTATRFCRFLLSLETPRDSSQINLDADGHVPDITVNMAEEWNREFRGDAVARFLRFTINDLACRPFCQRRYFDGSAIIQASGTGKTRLALELGKYAPLLYMCLRLPEDASLQSFPPADSAPIEYFDSLRIARDTEGVDIKGLHSLQVAAFVGA